MFPIVIMATLPGAIIIPTPTTTSTASPGIAEKTPMFLPSP